MFSRRHNICSRFVTGARAPMAALGVCMAMSALPVRAEPQSDAQSDGGAYADGTYADLGYQDVGQIIEVCVETRTLVGGFGQPECYLISSEDRAAFDFGVHDAVDGGDSAAQTQPLARAPERSLQTRSEQQRHYGDGDWKHELPDAAMWMVAFKAPGASLSRKQGNSLFLGDNLRHGQPDNGIGALKPNTARDGLPFESVGLRLQIAY